jgi:hypothetical protein
LPAFCDFCTIYSREAGSSKDCKPGVPGNGGEPGGPVYRESVVKRLRGVILYLLEIGTLNKILFHISCFIMANIVLDHEAKMMMMMMTVVSRLF